jgi:hypothetical protein
MLVLFSRRFKGLRRYGLITTTAKAGIASVPVALFGYGGYSWLAGMTPDGLMGEVIRVGICLALGMVGYLAVARALRLRELDIVWGLVERRLRPGRAA